MHGSMIRNAVLLIALVFSNALVIGGEDRHGEAGRSHGAALVSITPGTLVGNRPPATWSHLVIKSVPRLKSGDLGTLPASAFRTATEIRTVILADVGRSADDSSKFVLRRVGIGLCIPGPSRGDVASGPGRTRSS